MSSLGSPALGLRTDQYELTMLETSLHSGVAHRNAVFEVFTRDLPPHRPFGVACGQGRLAELIGRFTFSPSDLDALGELGALGKRSAAFLENFSFSGSISCYAEGELFFPDSPVLTVEAPFGEGLLLETLILSVLNHDSAVASAALRMVIAARGRRLIEMGSRRTHEDAAVAAARAAYVAGFDSTSNLEAARRYGIPSAGTAAHALVLAHLDEAAAFAHQVATLGPSTTLLVDTFDVESGIRNAVQAAGSALGGIRIDSGDLWSAASQARKLLDSLGAPSADIVLSGNLDEYAIDSLADAPVDAFGVGTSVVSGSGYPNVGFVYKLVAIEDADGKMVPVAKTSPAKVGHGGRKWAWRMLDDGGMATEEICFVGSRPERGDLEALGPPGGSTRPLQAELISGGIGAEEYPGGLDAARSRVRTSLAELPGGTTSLAGSPLPVRMLNRTPG